MDSYKWYKTQHFNYYKLCWLQSSIVLHDVLHSFIKGRGKGTAIMETELEQQLARIVNKIFSQVFLKVRKAYDSLDQGRCMEILCEWKYYVSMAWVQQYWDVQRVVSKPEK